MRAFRSLRAFVDRLGLTLDDGRAAISLPYSEGQMLVSLADDWRRVRVPLQIATFGGFGTQALVAANFRLAALHCGRRALRLIHVDPIGSGSPVAISRTTGNPGAESPFAVGPLEGADVAVTAATARFVGYAAQPGAFIATHFVIHALANEASPPDWLPRLLLPGESIFFQGPVAQALQLAIAWEEYPDSDDVNTSAARRPS